LAVLQGCVSVPVTYAPPERDAAAKQFQCPEGLSRVYVFRDSNFGYLYPMTLAIDEKRIGDFAAMTFGVFDLPPGSYEFSSATPESTSSVLVDAATGSISYLCLEVKMGWMYPRVLLQSVDATRGEAGVNRSKMITFAQDERRQRGGAGTAWLVSPNHWVTNAHVVGDRKVVKLTRGADLVIEARVMTIDPVNDLAVLVSDVPCLTASPLPLATTTPKVGERVIALGYPLSHLLSSAPKLTTGDLSALAGLADDPRMYQFSAPVQPGNSGGPLLNSSGEVVGIVSSKLNWRDVAKSAGAIPEGVAYAVKVAYLRPMLDGVTLSAPGDGPPQSAEEVFSVAGPAVFWVQP
jgi:S1-C subfamily serine protease